MTVAQIGMNLNEIYKSLVSVFDLFNYNVFKHCSAFTMLKL